MMGVLSRKVHGRGSRSMRTRSGLADDSAFWSSQARACKTNFATLQSCANREYILPNNLEDGH